MIHYHIEHGPAGFAVELLREPTRRGRYLTLYMVAMRRRVVVSVRYW